MTNHHRCPCCGAYSLTPDWPRNGFVCAVYTAFVPDERMPRR